jgi:hypothetical protein
MILPNIGNNGGFNYKVLGWVWAIGFFSCRRTVNSNQFTVQSIDRRNSIINSRRQPFKIWVFRANNNTAMVRVLNV